MEAVDGNEQRHGARVHRTGRCFCSSHSLCEVRGVGLLIIGVMTARGPDIGNFQVRVSCRFLAPASAGQVQTYAIQYQRVRVIAFRSNEAV